MKKRNELTILCVALYCGVVFCAFLAYGMHSEAMEIIEPAAPEVTADGPVRKCGGIEADPLLYVTPDDAEPLVYLDECVELPAVNVIEDCVITYYCTERYAHICGTGDGITATGAEATPGVTCAVDPAVIPFGSIVCVDYGDGVLHEYIAQDSGAWVNEDHVDLCVGTHDEALALGKKNATVYWSAPDTKPSECGGMPERQVTAQERCDWLPELIQGSSSEMNGLSALDGNEGYATCENETAVYWEAA